MKYWNIVILHILFSVRPLPNTNAPLQPTVASCWWCCHNNRTWLVCLTVGLHEAWQLKWLLTASQTWQECNVEGRGTFLRDIKKSKVVTLRKVCWKRVCYSFFWIVCPFLNIQWNELNHSWIWKQGYVTLIRRCSPCLWLTWWCSGMLLCSTMNSILAGPFACSHCLNTKATQLHLTHRLYYTLLVPVLFVAYPLLYCEWDLSVCLWLQIQAHQTFKASLTNNQFFKLHCFLRVGHPP